MSNSQFASPFESFNARALAPHLVARTFIPPGQFFDLIKRSHTLVVGPRGSGKTTLLKMLQSPALEAWAHEEAEEVRKRIDFTGVFVPADLAWSGQVGALHPSTRADEYRVVYGNAAFSFHVLRALTNAMHYRVAGPENPELVPHRRVSMTRITEAEVARTLADAWYLSSEVASLAAVKNALTRRLQQIWEVASKERLLATAGRDERLADVDFLHVSFIDAVSVGIETFNEACDEPEARWALLFDELELAPKWLRQRLVQALRSVEPRLLFKLSLSPFNEDAHLLNEALSAAEGHDFLAVSLSYGYKEENYAFSRALLRSMLEARGIRPKRPEDVLGRSVFQPDRGSWRRLGSAYEPGSVVQKRVSRLADTDPSFMAYLKKKGVDVERIGEMSESERAADVRKIAPLVAVREAFRHPGPHGHRPDEARSRQLRTRKNTHLYRGAASIFAIAEGNPRWFIGIFSDLVDTYASRKKQLAAPTQTRVINAAVGRFKALMRALPANGEQATDATGVVPLLDRIGDYFFDRIVIDDFNPDPPGSFTVDAKTDEATLEALGKALNAGALVYVADTGVLPIIESLRGKRFRLSYLLAPSYGLPIRLGRAVSLSTILNDGSHSTDADQFDLFANGRKP